MSKQTCFASPQRDTKNQLARQQQALLNAPFIVDILNTLPDMMLVLNEQRQIVVANDLLLKALGMDLSQLTGMRPGEALHCIHSEEGPHGCGTAEACAACGAVLTILASQKSGQQKEGECRLVHSLNGTGALDLAIQVTPLQIEETSFTVVALKDISSEKRRKVLERTFFHDILNMIGGINGIAKHLVETGMEMDGECLEFKQLLVELSDNLLEEISGRGLPPLRQPHPDSESKPGTGRCAGLCHPDRRPHVAPGGGKYGFERPGSFRRRGNGTPQVID
ncbi:MAG: PAS domain-containing protein [Desulfuromonadaceae bacterium]